MRIKEILREHDITQKELAAKMGITEVGLSKALKGNTTIATVERIAHALNVPMWQLFASAKDVLPKKGSIELSCPVCGAELELTTK